MIQLPNILRSGRSLMLAAGVMLMAAACNKEAKLTPSDDNRLYHLPQGNQPVDQQIVDFARKYNSYILYKFTEADFIYSPTGPFDKTATVVPAGPANVQAAFNFLKANLFDNYTEEFLQKYMPLKILLADQMSYRLDVYAGSPGAIYYPPARDGYDQITFGWANKVASFTPMEIDSARGYLNAAMLTLAATRNLLKIPYFFKQATGSYFTASNEPKRNGVLRPQMDFNETKDYRDYLQMIATTDYATLNSTLFTPANDPYGTFRKKYDIIVNYYTDSLGVDLKAIGNK